jgi:beta-glucanase (GH16 family)
MTQQRRALVRAVVALSSRGAVTCAVLALLPAVAEAASGSALPAGNLIPNASFESSTSGWSGWQSSLASAPDAAAPDGARVAVVSRTTGTQYSVDDTPSQAQGVGAGTYVATAWVRAGASQADGKPIAIAIRERSPAGSTVKVTTSATAVLGGAYAPISVSATLVTAGDSLNVYVIQSSAAKGNAFRVDAVSLAPVTSYGFDDGTTDGWSLNYGGGSTGVTAMVVHGGTGALQLNLAGSGNAGFVSPAHPTGIVPGTVVSYWVYAPAGSSITAEPFTVDGAGNYDYVEQIPTLAGQWRQISFRVPALTGGLRYLGIHFQDGQGWAGPIELDDVASGVVTPPPAAPAVFTAPTAAPSATPAPLGPGGSWQLTFDDEFSGTSVDRNTWSPCLPWGCQGAQSSEQECYSAGNLVEGGNELKLEATAVPSTCAGASHPYTSGMITSWGSYRFRYGFVEERFRLPAGAGMWPAFWLLPVNEQWPPEIDAFEANGSNPDAITMHYHYGSSGYAPGWSFSGPDFTAGFHTVGVDVEPGAVSWYVDGQLWCIYDDTTQLATVSSPWYILSDLAVQGATGVVGFPASFEIDYIRAWTH